MFKKLLYIVIPILHCLFFVENSFGQSYQQIGDPEHQIEINELMLDSLIYNKKQLDNLLRKLFINFLDEWRFQKPANRQDSQK